MTREEAHEVANNLNAVTLRKNVLELQVAELLAACDMAITALETGNRADVILGLTALKTVVYRVRCTR